MTMIIGSPDAIALKKRMEKLERQMEALIDGMAGLGQAVESAADLLDEHDKKLKNKEVFFGTGPDGAG